MDRMAAIEAVQMVQDYIETHINEPISLKDMAEAAGYSPWHTTRIFKELLGKSPFDYLRALRLSKAALLLRDGHPRVIDVALDFVFSSHEGFSRAFAREFGVAPKAYSRTPEPIPLFMPFRVRDQYLTLGKGVAHMNESIKNNTVFVQVMERPPRKLLLKRGITADNYFDYCHEVGCDDVWGTLCSVKEALYEPAGVWLPKGMQRPGTGEYAQGVEVPLDYAGKIPPGYEIIELPACKMMVFQGEPFEDENFMSAIENLWEVMKKYNPELYGFQWDDEAGPRFQLEPQGYRGYIEGRPVTAIN